MHSFFVFCVANDMLGKNPMDALKKPKTPDVVPTDYFLPKEFEQTVAATEKSQPANMATACKNLWPLLPERGLC
jgi:site-specific recombinase XerD